MYNNVFKGKWVQKVRKPNCIHKYNFIKTQDSENFKTGQMGIASFYKCEKCGKEKVEYKYNNDINSDLWNI
ncbi:hypothetical protein [Bacillus pseudomycoides]|uniref:hypothetical protein n=1 Tax=Bacillus pseudomycoides TaxID=64104 RepID=UPI000BEBFA07|nr:hypothetical protein [Bacillus pseudomycoides]PED09081.1 hypothetical protein COO19_06205 [Bacillus pseudomycoides]PEI97461.1 hypothetical protein CN686_08405 [Bacillus pseudomycoides]PEK29558.1 hypothetical protein CN693_01910 [Bacillus pseudomycoides]PEM71706.1 hypothetical protein CN619_17980 [Bacillus pseudomycoides]PEO23382.1 hypothetical protein CN542_01795 [Bacillus pseudomycoides]